MCAHAKGPISICRKRVGLKVGSVETRKQCIHKNKLGSSILWLLTVPGKSSPNCLCIALEPSKQLSLLQRTAPYAYNYHTRCSFVLVQHHLIPTSHSLQLCTLSTETHSHITLAAVLHSFNTTSFLYHTRTRNSMHRYFISPSHLHHTRCSFVLVQHHIIPTSHPLQCCNMLAPPHAYITLAAVVYSFNTTSFPQHTRTRNSLHRYFNSTSYLHHARCSYVLLQHHLVPTSHTYSQ